MAPVELFRVKPVGKRPAVRAYEYAGLPAGLKLATTELVELETQPELHQVTPTVPEISDGAVTRSFGVTGIVTPIWLLLRTGELDPVLAVITIGRLTGVANGTVEELDCTELPDASWKADVLGGS
jgi:hypothetical protein